MYENLKINTAFKRTSKIYYIKTLKSKYEIL